MEQHDNIRRQKLIKYIKSNNPFFLFASFNYYTLEMLEKLKTDIDEEIKTHRKTRMGYLLN